MKRTALLVPGLLAVATFFATQAGAQLPATDVRITADNAYRFGWGSVSSIPAANLFGGVENTSAGAIFNCPLSFTQPAGPERYTVNGANLSDYLYIISWSDANTTQGVLGQFQTGTNPPLYTGYPGWEVYATGMYFTNFSGGPPLATINTQIGIANAGTGTAGLTSIGWVGPVVTPGREGVLVFGEDNTTNRTSPTCPNPFPIVCQNHPPIAPLQEGIDAAAKWMWYQRPNSTCAFLDGNHREFLIFRIPLQALAGGDCAPLTQGFWKRQCKGAHPSGESGKLDSYASCLAATATFGRVRTVADICDALHPDPKNDKCEQAEAQFAALLLNTCSNRLSRACCIDTRETTATTAGDAIDEIDLLLSNPARTFADCVLAQSIADAINTAAALCR